jgi:hypothetical protein
MFLVRKIGSVLRGNATPFQVLLATGLGGTLGFVPGFFLPGDLGGGFLQAPGLILVLLCLALLLNANLAVFGLTTLVAKLASLPLLPVSYAIGTWLLEGPLQGLFAGLIDGKVTAWFGLEYYATAGGLVTGLAFGLVVGLLLNRLLRAVRTRMAGLEENSETYQKYARKRSVRLLSWVFLGKGKGKLTWKQLAERRKLGLPVRPTGVLLAAVLVGSLWVVQTWFSAPVLTRVTRSGLESVNGATVDLREASVAFGSGRAQLLGLAIADREDPTKDLLAADELVAHVDTGELLRKRVVIKSLVSDSVRSGATRQVPGRRFEPPPPPPPPEPTGTRTIEDWLADFELWKQRLEQVQQWIEVLTGGDPPPPPTPEQQRSERRRQEAAGLARVVATHLLPARPRFLIEEVAIRGIGYSIQGKAERIDLLAKNLTDAPALVPGDLAFDLKAQSGAFAFGLLRPSPANRPANAPAVGMSLAMNDLAVDRVFGGIKVAGAPPLRGGTMQLALAGGLQRRAGGGYAIDLPLQVTLRDTVFALAGFRETKVESLALPVGLRGPLVRPAVLLDDKVLHEALLAAGQRELANFVQAQAGRLLGGLPSQLQGVIDPGKGVQENVDAAKAKLEAEAKKAEEEARQKAKQAEEEAKRKLLEEAKKKLPGGLPGVLPGGGERKKQ